MRRVVVALVVAATLFVPAVGAAPIASNANASRAIQAYRARQRYRSDARSGAYRGGVGERACAPPSPTSPPLHALTQRARLLQWSQRMLNWLDRCMLAPNGLYWDHIDANGVVDYTHWSYNQGSLIGADVLLYRQTHDADALARAEALADATLA